VHESARPAAARLLEFQGPVLLDSIDPLQLLLLVRPVLAPSCSHKSSDAALLRLQVYEDGEAAAGYTFGKVLGGDETVKTGAFPILISLPCAGSAC
jgi:hypothetical protein